MTFEKTVKYDEAAAKDARVALNKLRDEGANMEDLLVGPARHRSPRHMMPVNLRGGFKMR